MVLLRKAEHFRAQVGVDFLEVKLDLLVATRVFYSLLVYFTRCLTSASLLIKTCFGLSRLSLKSPPSLSTPSLRKLRSLF